MFDAGLKRQNLAGYYNQPSNELQTKNNGFNQRFNATILPLPMQHFGQKCSPIDVNRRQLEANQNKTSTHDTSHSVKECYSLMFDCLCIVINSITKQLNYVGFIMVLLVILDGISKKYCLLQ